MILHNIGTMKIQERQEKRQNKKIVPTDITKIEEKTDGTDNAVKIGKIIKNIDNYNVYFSPIESICSVSIAKIDDSDIQKCEFATNRVKNMVSITTKNVGNMRVIDFLKTHVHDYGRIYSHVMEGIRILAENNIVHFNINTENIMYDENRHVPIIVGFEDAIRMLEDGIENFSESANDWNSRTVPIDVFMMLRWTKELEQKDDNNEKIIETLLDEYCETNTEFLQMLGMKKKEWKKNHEAYYSEISRTKDGFTRTLMKNWRTWDKVAVNIFFLRFLRTYHKTNTKEIGRLVSELIRHT